MTRESVERREGRPRGRRAGGRGERGRRLDRGRVHQAHPSARPHSQPFFDGTLRGELMLQRCGACGTWMWPVRTRCIECFSDDLAWTAARGTGTLYSYTLVHQVFHPGFASEVPYNVAMVDLDEGVRMVTNIVGVPDEELPRRPPARRGVRADQRRAGLAEVPPRRGVTPHDALLRCEGCASSTRRTTPPTSPVACSPTSAPT